MSFKKNARKEVKLHVLMHKQGKKRMEHACNISGKKKLPSSISNVSGQLEQAMAKFALLGLQKIISVVFVVGNS